MHRVRCLDHCLFDFERLRRLLEPVAVVLWRHGVFVGWLWCCFDRRRGRSGVCFRRTAASGEGFGW